MATAAEVQASYKAIVRADLNATTAQALAEAINNGSTTLAAYQQSLIAQTASTSGAAVAIASFVTGVTPTSAKLDELKVAADAQVASYTKMGVANPALGAFEAFGKGFSQEAAFTTKYGALSNGDFINTVYIQVYGVTPSAAALANLSGQLTYFTTLYTNAGLPNAAAQAKGAVLGQIVGYAFIDTNAAANSTLDNSVNTFFVNAANGSTTGYAAPLPITTGSGTPGAILTLTAAADVVDPTAVSLQFKSTGGDDTIRSLAAADFASADVINGGGGTDSIIANTAAIAAATTVAPVLTSVEKVFVAGTNLADSIFSGAASTGLQEVWNDGSGGVNSQLTINNIGTTVTAGVKGITTSTTVAFSGVAGTNDTAKVALDAVDGNLLTVAGVENLQFAIGGSATGTTTLTDTVVKTFSFANIAGQTGNAQLTLDAGSLANLTSIDASAMKGGVTVASFAEAANFTVTGGAGADSFAFTGNKVITATLGAGNDTLVTGTAKDVISLGDGNDIVTAGGEADSITVGAGNDIVKFAATGDSKGTAFDTIVDFKTAGSDILDISAIDADTVVALDQAFTFIGGASKIAVENAVSALAANATLTDALNAVAGVGLIDNGQVGSFAFKGDTYVFANTTTAAYVDANDLVVKLTGVVSVSAADFTL